MTQCSIFEYERKAPNLTTDRECVSCASNQTLDCSNPSSRSIVANNNICEVAAVENCCCEEFYTLTRVSEYINVRQDETMLHFGSIQEVVGDITRIGATISNYHSLETVNFSLVTTIEGNINLGFHKIEVIQLSKLSSLKGDFFLDHNKNRNFSSWLYYTP